jgi:Na+/glutamate symporter
MELSTLISLVTILVTWLLGYISKRSTWVNNRIIPIQNILIGLIVAIVEWIVTKDFKVAIALSGIIAGGTYDVFHNLEKIVKGE